jgi:hypothetical protein
LVLVIGFAALFFGVILLGSGQGALQ